METNFNLVFFLENVLVPSFAGGLFASLFWYVSCRFIQILREGIDEDCGCWEVDDEYEEWKPHIEPPPGYWISEQDQLRKDFTEMNRRLMQIQQDRSPFELDDLSEKPLVENSHETYTLRLPVAIGGRFIFKKDGVKPDRTGVWVIVRVAIYENGTTNCIISRAKENGHCTDGFTYPLEDLVSCCVPVELASAEMLRAALGVRYADDRED